MINWLDWISCSYLQDNHIDGAKVEYLVVAGSIALEVVDLCAGPVLAVVVGEQGVVVLVHPKVDHITPSNV